MRIFWWDHWYHELLQQLEFCFIFWPRKFCYLNVTMFCKHLSPTLSTSLNPNFWGTVSKARSSTLDIKMIKSINLLKKKSLNRFLICKIYFSHIYQKRIQYGFRPFNFTLYRHENEENGENVFQTNKINSPWIALEF